MEINLEAVTTADELHTLLSQALGFPDWYGRNWDAFRDAITGLVEMPAHLRLSGWEGFAGRLPNDARLMRNCLANMSDLLPEAAPEVEFV